VSAAGIFSGLLCGVAVVAFLIFTKRDPWMGMNPGFVALCLNFAVVAAVTLVLPSQASEDANIFASTATSV
jgi:SSS family solute:Na+ symporter